MRHTPINWSPLVGDFKTLAEVRNAVRRFCTTMPTGLRSVVLPIDLLSPQIVVALVLRLRARRVTPLWNNGQSDERFARAGD